MSDAQKEMYEPPKPKQKNIVVAYLLLVFLGFLGAHNFYLKRLRLAGSEFILGVLLVPTLYYSSVLLIPLLILDLFTIPRAARNASTKHDHAGSGYDNYQQSL